MTLRHMFLGALVAASSVIVVAAQPAATLQVTLLGTGNPRPNLERFGPSILVEAGGHRLLIDAGRGAAQRLFEIGSARSAHRRRRALPDPPALRSHGGSAGRLAHELDLRTRHGAAGRGPAGTAEMAGHLAQAYQWDIASRATTRLPRRRRATGGVERATRRGVRRRRPARHRVCRGPRRVCRAGFGYRVDYRGRQPYSRGTCASTSALWPRHGRRRDGGGSAQPRGRSPPRAGAGPPRAGRILARHISPEQAGTLFTRAKPRLAVFTHIVPSPATAEDLVPATRRTYAGPLAVGYDQMTIVIGDTVETFPRKTLSDKCGRRPRPGPFAGRAAAAARPLFDHDGRAAHGHYEHAALPAHGLVVEVDADHGVGARRGGVLRPLGRGRCRAPCGARLRRWPSGRRRCRGCRQTGP